MAQNSFIRQLLAGVLLLVFSFSITPKKFLHDAIANHKDKSAIVTTGDIPQLSHSGFVCKCDNLVAESPFTDAVVSFDFVVQQDFSISPEIACYHFYSSPVVFSKLRGPPAAGIYMM